MFSDFIKQRKAMFHDFGVKISRFSCLSQPVEIAYKSIINGPKFTKFGSYIANYVYFEN